MTKQNNDKNEKRIWWKKKWKNKLIKKWREIDKERKY